MATFTITIPNDKLQDMINAYGKDWAETLPDGTPNPQTKAQFARSELNRHIKQRVIDYKKSIYALPNFDDSGITVS